jgi:hypothetical protein
MPAYDDRHFSPPAPVLHATLRNPGTGAAVSDVMLLIDTGSDVTFLPVTAADSIRIEPSGERYELSAFDGTKSIADAIRADLSLLGRNFRGQFLLTEAMVGILGRNVLNNLSLILDGPRLTWEEKTPLRGA